MLAFYDGFYFWGMDLIWWIVWIIFILLIIRKKSPLAVLEMRFASGEMTEEEYKKRKGILEEEACKKRGLKYRKRPLLSHHLKNNL